MILIVQSFSYLHNDEVKALEIVMKCSKWGKKHVIIINLEIFSPNFSVSRWASKNTRNLWKEN